MRGTLIFSLILAILAVIFALANPQEMDVNLVFTQIQGSTALVLILTLVIGVIIGILATIPNLYRERKKRKMVEESEDPGMAPSTGKRKSSSYFGSKKKQSSPPEQETPPEEPPDVRPSSTSGRPHGTPLGKDADPDRNNDDKPDAQ